MLSQGPLATGQVPLSLEGAAADSWEMDTAAEPTVGAAPSPRRIGEIFVDRGFITKAQLEAALDVQREKGGRLGEILVEQGHMTRLDLASALTEYWDPHGYQSTPRLDPSLVAGADGVPDGRRDAVAALEQRVDELARTVAELGAALELVLVGLARSAEFPGA
jgi:hypothetical protein